MDNKSQTDKEKMALIKTIFNTYRNMRLEESILYAWLLVVQDFSVEQVKRGVQKLFQEHTSWVYPPVPGQLVNAIRRANGLDAPRSDKKNLELIASAEWKQICKERERVGLNGMPILSEFSHHVLVSIGGWERICCVKLQWLWRVEKEFIENFFFIAKHRCLGVYLKNAERKVLSDKEACQLLQSVDEKTGRSLLDRRLPEKQQSSKRPLTQAEIIEQEGITKRKTAICKEVDKKFAVELKKVLHKVTSCLASRPLGEAPKLEELMPFFTGTDFDEDRLRLVITRALFRTESLFALTSRKHTFKDSSTNRLFAAEELTAHIYNIFVYEEKVFRLKQVGIPETTLCENDMPHIVLRFRRM